MSFETPKNYVEISHDEVRELIGELRTYTDQVESAVSHEENIDAVSFESLQKLSKKFIDAFENLKIKAMEIALTPDESVTQEISDEARRLRVDISTLSMFARNLTRAGDKLNDYDKNQFPEKVPFDMVRMNLIVNSQDTDLETWRLLKQIENVHPLEESNPNVLDTLPTREDLKNKPQ